MFHYSKIPRILHSSWFIAALSLEKLCHEVMARNELADLQPTFNKGEGRASLTIFVTECLQN